MVAFEQDILSRFVGTDEREWTEYSGCEVIRDREAKPAKMVQSGRARVEMFVMCHCHPTP